MKKALPKNHIVEQPCYICKKILKVLHEFIEKCPHCHKYGNYYLCTPCSSWLAVSNSLICKHCGQKIGDGDSTYQRSKTVHAPAEYQYFICHAEGATGCINEERNLWGALQGEVCYWEEGNWYDEKRAIMILYSHAHPGKMIWGERACFTRISKKLYEALSRIRNAVTYPEYKKVTSQIQSAMEMPYFGNLYKKYQFRDIKNDIEFIGEWLRFKDDDATF